MIRVEVIAAAAVAVIVTVTVTVKMIVGIKTTLNSTSKLHSSNNSTDKI